MSDHNTATRHRGVAMVNMAPMATNRRSRGLSTSPPASVMVGIKGVTPELHRRMRVAAAEEGVPYHKLIDLLLDQREARQRRQRAAQASPLHRPPADHLDDEAVPL